AGGRSRLPTWSARNGGLVRTAIVTLLDLPGSTPVTTTRTEVLSSRCERHGSTATRLASDAWRPAPRGRRPALFAGVFDHRREREGAMVGAVHARGRPPSTARTLPVVKVRSRTAARTAAATSPGDARRPSGVRASWSSRQAGSSERMKPVSTTPGDTETTRIRGASARPSERVRLSSAAFDAQYATLLPCPVTA